MRLGQYVEPDREYCVHRAASLHNWVREQAVVAKAIGAGETQHSSHRHFMIKGLAFNRSDLIGIRLGHQFVIAFADHIGCIKVGVHVIDPDISQFLINLRGDSPQFT